MAVKPKLKHKKAFIFLSIIFVLIGGFAIAQTTHAPTSDTSQIPTGSNSKGHSGSQPLQEVPNKTISGEVVCLPHKDTSGPQTLECALGLKADNGNYYALDSNLLGTNPPPYTTGDRIEATGLITPFENLSSDHWQKYNMRGIFSVREVDTIN